MKERKRTVRKAGTQSEYSKLLLDPRWQKKRLEILSRDDWSCKNCGYTEETLHVHHCYYEKGKKPWEYPDTSLLTLCATCHQEETYDDYTMRRLLTDSLASKGILATQFHELACAFQAVDIVPLNEYYFSALAWFISLPESPFIIMDAFAEHLKKKREHAEG